ncbi:MAG: trypsin-like serine peptidase [Lysobacteraceae bacterium]
MSTFRLTLALLTALAATAPTIVAASEAPGEPSRTPAAAAPQWRATVYPAADVARMAYGAMPAKRLLDLQRKNAAPGLKATQIGIGRDAVQEGAQSHLPPLKWVPVAGGWVARAEVRSADAMALRVGLDVSNLADRVELRFAGSARPNDVVAVMTGAEVKRLPGTDGHFWTPGTDGETQIIELFRPKGVPAFAARIDAPVLSHLVADSRNSFKLVEKIGESGSCNVDVICRVNELGQNYVNAKNAVARMIYNLGSSSYLCTGTLLADTVPQTQVPYFLSANHCFSSNTSAAPVPSQMQTVANTLNTYWNYETTACGNFTSTAVTQLSGGATYLYSDNNTDGMLIRLNNAPPASAYFAGWNAATIADGTPVFAIHHPRGDSKKVSSGQVMSKDADNIEIAWLNGTTEGGSSGSGLFTSGPNGFVVRGGLYGGYAACSNSGTTTNTQNRDYYSRLDVYFPNIKTWLEPQPGALNGSAPRSHPKPSGTVAAPSMQASPAQPTTTNAPRGARLVPVVREGAGRK